MHPQGHFTCNGCGVQVFVRGRPGIEAFDRLVARAHREGLLTTVAEMARRYRRTCPQCAHEFWIEPALIATSLFDGRLKGVRCPGAGCGAILPWEPAS